MPESLRESLPLVLGGLVIVFAVLALIALVIAGIRQLDERWRYQEKARDAARFDRAPTVDERTLVLIVAAAATVLAGRFRIRRIRRLLPPDAPRSPWSAQGRTLVQGSHVIDRRTRRGPVPRIIRRNGT